MPGVERFNKKADLIIKQPEIKRMLLRMRCQIEGGRALATYVGYHVDVMQKSQDQSTKKRADNIVSLLTPIVKCYLSDLGMESSLNAQQVFGGHGYVHDYGMEQLVRDCRITTIYEGTNEVQAADLVFRKLMLKNNQLIKTFIEEWEHALFLEKSFDDAALNFILDKTRESFGCFKKTTAWIIDQVNANPLFAMGASSAYTRYFSLNMVALLWADILVSILNKKGNFYNSKRKLAKFFILHVLPETLSLEKQILDGGSILSEFESNDF